MERRRSIMYTDTNQKSPLLRVTRLSRPEIWRVSSFASDPDLLSVDPEPNCETLSCPSSKDAPPSLFPRTFTFGDDLFFPYYPRKLTETSRVSDHMIMQDHLMGSNAIYLILLRNTFEVDIKIMSIKVLLESAKKKVYVLDPQNFTAEKLLKHQSREFVVNFDIRDAIDHSLRVEVTILRGDQDRRLLKCSVPIKVLIPLDIKSRPWIIGEKVFYEFTVHNLTKIPITLKDPSFVGPSGLDTHGMESLVRTASNYDAIAHESSTTGALAKQESSVFGDLTYLMPATSRSYIYAISMKPNTGKPSSPQQGVWGRFEVSWSSASGGFGRFQTVNIEVEMKHKRQGFSATLSSTPSKTYLEEPFQITLALQNLDTVPFSYKLETHPEKMTSFLVMNVIGKKRGYLMASETTSFHLTLYPLKCGLGFLDGLVLFVTRENEDEYNHAADEEQFDLEDFPDILVESRQEAD
eukprot:TRINITY_DN6433_c0_g1_i1.p1 TRINITY_DN6433_c0_g1~~TRINITY_DN6433_c0_g1_i1.p1  ORF type:complete len:465 (+),score=73.95 TRINITY_DN6433_c0_g1_i1:66-1460(+)